MTGTEPPSPPKKSWQNSWQVKALLGITTALGTAGGVVWEVAGEAIKPHLHNNTLVNQVCITNKSDVPLTILADVPINKEGEARRKPGINLEHKFPVTIRPGGTNPDYTDSDLIPVKEPITIISPGNKEKCEPGNFIRTSGRLDAELDRQGGALYLYGHRPLPFDNYSSLVCLPPDHSQVQGITSSFKDGLSPSVPLITEVLGKMNDYREQKDAPKNHTPKAPKI